MIDKDMQRKINRNQTIQSRRLLHRPPQCQVIALGRSPDLRVAHSRWIAFPRLIAVACITRLNSLTVAGAALALLWLFIIAHQFPV